MSNDSKCPSVAEIFVEAIINEGVEFAFGLPGEENADVALALQTAVDAGRIKMVLVRHEQGAAFMADVYGRLTGKAALCFGTLGPGATNLVTGVADANMDRAPLVVYCGQADVTRLHKESHQNLDIIGLFRPITKWAHSILTPEATTEVVRKAFKLALQEKPGATMIELPEDVAHMPIEKAAHRQLMEARKVRRAVIDDKVADQAWEALKTAKCPVILAGNGCVRKRASKQLRQFAESTGIGVINTFMSKGAVDMDSEHALFTIGLQSRDFNSLVIDAADIVLVIGFDMVEYHPRLWNPDGKKKIIHADFLPAEVDRQYEPAVELVGDLAHTLWALNERQGRDPLPYTRDESTFALQRDMRKRLIDDFAAHKDDTAVGKIKPQKALWDCRQVLGPHDILLSDVGAHKMWVARYYQCHEPNTCLISNGFCSMGFSLPGAIAAKLVHPDRRVLAVSGDGSLQMNVQEMETAVRLGLKGLVVLVWVDNAYGLIIMKQQNRFGRHSDLAFGNPDLMKLAEAYGWAPFECDDSAKLGGVLEEAFNQDRPSLVVMPVDYTENKNLTGRFGDLEVKM